MKWNWGWNIVVVLGLFMTMIVIMVVKSVNTKVDLVAQDYYADEIAYQEQIDKEANAKALQGHFSWKNTEAGLIIEFPADLDAEHFTGTVKLYRPSDEKLDREFTFEGLRDHQFLIQAENLVTGKWEVQVDGTANGVAYYFEQRLKL
ncbi:MAG: FixH family protein [Flavobacteriales bacterium]|nr:FixH family protein [Flavobacteriales bacterium]